MTKTEARKVSNRLSRAGYDSDTHRYPRVMEQPESVYVVVRDRRDGEEITELWEESDVDSFFRPVIHGLTPSGEGPYPGM